MDYDSATTAHPTSIDRTGMAAALERPISVSRRVVSRRELQPDSEGLFRALRAGPGCTLVEAFASLERSPQIEQVLRHANRDLFGARLTLPAEEGEGYWEFTRIRDEIYVVVANFAYEERRVEHVAGDNLIHFSFKISGDTTLAVSATEVLRWNRPSLLVRTQPKGVAVSEWTAARAQERYITISVRPEFLTAELLTPNYGIPRQLQPFIANNCEGIRYCQLPLRPLMFDVASKLIGNPFTGLLSLVRIEALTLELLCNAVEAVCMSGNVAYGEYTEREVRCLRAARGILTNQLAPAPTIAQLARSVGMGESALTKGFKSMFGQTIFEFSLCCRMQYAMSMICDRQWSVTKASEATGYAHASSFTTAFRRHFGTRPRDLRRGRSR